MELIVAQAQVHFLPTFTATIEPSTRVKIIIIRTEAKQNKARKMRRKKRRNAQRKWKLQNLNSVTSIHRSSPGTEFICAQFTLNGIITYGIKYCTATADSITTIDAAEAPIQVPYTFRRRKL